MVAGMCRQQRVAGVLLVLVHPESRVAMFTWVSFRDLVCIGDVYADAWRCQGYSGHVMQGSEDVISGRLPCECRCLQRSERGIMHVSRVAC